MQRLQHMVIEQALCKAFSRYAACVSTWNESIAASLSKVPNSFGIEKVNGKEGEALRTVLGFIKYHLSKAFNNLTLTLIHTAQGQLQCHLTPLSPLQHQILQS